jgi:hypothetical protein
MDVGAPAVVAAIHDAVGTWIHELPASPERILASLGLTALPGPVVPSPAAVESGLADPIEAGPDPRPDAPTDPQPMRGPRDPDEPR